MLVVPSAKEVTKLLYWELELELELDDKRNVKFNRITSQKHILLENQIIIKPIAL
jgi:hypothetical protein